MIKLFRKNLNKWLKASDLKIGMKIAVPEASVFSRHGGKMADNSILEKGEGDIMWDEIIEIKKHKEEKVYDIEVEGTHNFIAGHLIDSISGKQLSVEEERMYLGLDEEQKKPLSKTGKTSAVGLPWFGGIFAHNTYISGGLGVNRTSPAAGNIDISGSYLTNGADYAEYFYTLDTDLKPGEAVCVDVKNKNSVIRCTRCGDTNLMGIVSSNPSIVGNGGENKENNPNYKIIGMLGQVPAKVSTENGEIRPGDSLTSASTTPGILMKANAGDPTVGVALEGLNKDSVPNGMINVLISRRNKSITVEEVEEKVTERIANMEIEDEVNILISNAINTLNLDEEINENLDPKLLLLETKLKTESDNVNNRINNAEKNIGDLINNLGNLKNNLLEISDNQSFFRETQNKLINQYGIINNKLLDLNKVITIGENTNVGIGTTTESYKLNVNGEITTMAFINISAQGLQSDISSLSKEDIKSIINSIKNTKISKYRHKNESNTNPMRLGVIAEEAPEEILSIDKKGIDLYKMTSFILTGTKELIRELEELKITVKLLDNGHLINPENETITGDMFTIDEDGYVVVNKIKTGEISVKENKNNKETMVGTGSILASATSTVITNINVTKNSKIFITLVTENAKEMTNQNLFVINKKENESFMVTIKNPENFDIKFDYWILSVESLETLDGSSNSSTLESKNVEADQVKEDESETTETDQAGEDETSEQTEEKQQTEDDTELENSSAKNEETSVVADDSESSDESVEEDTDSSSSDENADSSEEDTNTDSSDTQVEEDLSGDSDENDVSTEETSAESEQESTNEPEEGDSSI